MTRRTQTSNEWNFDPKPGASYAKTDADGLKELLMQIRYDSTAIQVKVTEALKLLGRMPGSQAVGGKLECPHCGPLPLNARQLAEHVYDVHAGPRPAHLGDLDARIAPDWTPNDA